MKKNSSQRGFTLIELMIVIAIIAILTLIGVGGYSSSLKKGRDARRKSDLQALAQALTLYRMDRAYYPSNPDEYFSTEACTSDPNCVPLSPNYIVSSGLYDPSSDQSQGMFGSPNSYGAFPYSYFCENYGGTTNKCKSFLLCTQLESDSGGNFQFIDNGGLVTVGSGSYNYQTMGAGGLKGMGGQATPSDVGNIIGRVEGTPQWYCAGSQ